MGGRQFHRSYLHTPLLADIHNRMPVILHPEDYELWLSAETDDALELASPFPSQNMKAWKVDNRVGSIKETGKELPEPIEAGRLL